MQASTSPNASWTWKSILKGRKVLERGIHWHIGDGKKVMAATDPWIPKDNGFKPTMVADFAKAFKVSHFIDDSSRKWKGELFQEVFNPKEAELIMGIPISRFEKMDTSAWHFTRNIIYTMKSGYEIALALRRNSQMGNGIVGEGSYRESRREMWKSVWALPCQEKNQTFHLEMLS